MIVCIDTKPLTNVQFWKSWPLYRYKHGMYRYKHQNLEILTDMYLSMQACFESYEACWFFRTYTHVSIHASMFRIIWNILFLYRSFCIDTEPVCIDTKCSKCTRTSFRTFVSIQKCMYRYKTPKSQFFKVLKIVLCCQVICKVCQNMFNLFSCVLTIIKTWGWTGALTFSPFLIIVKTLHKLTKPIPNMQ
jgi:hypothetical protein